MKFASVLKSDMVMFSQLINMLQAAEFSLNGKDVCASADTIRWLQQVAVKAAETFKADAEGPKPDAPSPVAPAVEVPSGGLEQGITLKQMHVGKGKK